MVQGSVQIMYLTTNTIMFAICVENYLARITSECVCFIGGAWNCGMRGAFFPNSLCIICIYGMM